MGESLRIIKTDDDQRLVFGWASVTQGEDGTDIIDSDGDVIGSDDLEAAVYDYVLKARNAGERHQGEPIGRMVESLMLTPSKAEAMGIKAPFTGWWLGVKIDDPSAFAKVKSGHYRMFSIEGTAESEPVTDVTP